MTADIKTDDTRQSSEYTLCIIHPNKAAYSETFIQAHIERLPMKVKVLYGGDLPIYTDDDKPLLPTGLLHKIRRTVLRYLLLYSPQDFQKEAVRRFIRLNKVDVVLAEYGPTGVAVMDICQDIGVPLIVHFHGFDAFDKRLLDKFEGKYLQMFEMVTSIIAASCSMRDRLIELHAPPNKVFVNPYGVDVSQFYSADSISSTPTFVSIGRFVDKKAPYLTLLSFKSVLEQCREARLVMVGSGILLEACKQMASSLGISSSVQFAGVLSSSEIAVLLRSARAFVQHSISTSYGDSESLGVVFLEAGASGLPVVATRHDGIPEVVIDGETGFLVDEGDIDEMAECMIRLAKDLSLATRLGKAARERISSEFYMEKSISNLRQNIEDVTQNYKGHKGSSSLD